MKLNALSQLSIHSFHTVMPFHCWRKIYVLKYITTFLGLILYLENNSVSLKALSKSET